MQKTLSLAAIGLRGVPVVQAVEIASAAGFDSLAVDINELQMLVGDLGSTRCAVFLNRREYARFWGLPFSWADDEKRTAGLEALPAQLDVAQKLGVPLAASGVSPVSDERDYAENLAWHAPKLREVGEAAEGGWRPVVGSEFIGPKTIRKDHEYEFAYSLPRMLELIDAAGTGNIGTTLDIWHLYTSGGTNADLDTLPLDRVDIVHVNDAPTGIDRDEQQDLVRALPPGDRCA